MEYEYLSLSVGKLEIDWRKNIIKEDHFALFQPGDKANVCYYFDNDDEQVVSKTGPGYSKPLDKVRERLKLLGYGYNKLPALLHEHIQSFVYERQDLKGFSPKKFLGMLSAVEIPKIDWVPHEADADYGEFFTRRILTLPQFGPIRSYLKEFPGASDLVFEQIHPYIILSALAENPLNRELPVEWRTKEKNVGLDKYETYLIVTEGPSDGVVLKKALHILRPEIADFFDFIDMRENYPFDNVSSMLKFFMGLIKIGTNRNMIFIFDNDTEGCYNFSRLDNIAHPPNMRKYVLPDMKEFENFKTSGTSGEAEENVNRRAVAIEMYLDHSYVLTRTPIVVWGGMHGSVQQLQGALKNKEDYTTKFVGLEEKDHEKYKFDKLHFLLGHLVKNIIG
ncbi:HEPN/Toprim-associated domain-containing protein [Mucilaginibacter sp. SJ]|uniref:HEPN/Toprim-associated domain-containing protein n=1 Tax=Mucilaginibacter sp. SJ TaxID=3029053 RepID=UPI0023A97B30|nr:HEPN/Toprim-associated domain-containing protein [Mucilaginibacter sp. SJ]WEA01712.1 HEPN/Toprim-associated domain-containing protein [Mucilaginibacter sp. SJ]